MTDRYNRYSRPRSPTTWNPARASLPLDMSYSNNHPSHVHSHHVVPAARHDNPRHSGTSFTSGPITTTTYKVKPDTRSSSRTRSSTVDSRTDNAATFTAVPRHRPIVHTTVVRPASPSLKSPYRSSQDDYYAVPATTLRSNRSHPNRYSASMDNVDMNRLSRERAMEKEIREPDHLRVGATREGQAYTNTGRTRGSAYSANMVRHPDTVADDYGEDGYGYTNARDLVQYDLNNSSPRHARRDSFEASRARPVSITGYSDVSSPRSYDSRERGPPPSTRGFDRIQTWEQPSVRMPVPIVSPIEPVQRPARMEPPAAFDADIPQRRTSTRRPVSMYQEQLSSRRPRDDYYEVRDDDLRDRRPQHRHERYDDTVEQRGFGLRPERMDRPERPASRAERTDRPERPVSRAERTDRPERPASRVERTDRRERSPRPEERIERRESKMEERHEKKSSTHEKLATGLSIASAALGLGAMANTLKSDDKDETDEPRRRKEYDEEPRRRRDRDDREEYEVPARETRERRHKDDDRDSAGSDRSDHRDGKERRHRNPERDSVETSGRDAKERRHRDETVPSGPKEPRRREDDEIPIAQREPRYREEVPPPPRDAPRESRDRHASDNPYVDISDRNPKERHNAQEERSRGDVSADATAHETHSDSSDEATNHRRRPRRISAAAAAPFNPRDTMDLKALKAALAGQDTSAEKEPVLAHAPKQPVQESLPIPSSRPLGRQSVIKDMREVAELRAELNKEDRGRREPLAPAENKQLRVVSPPREKSEDKPVKGILRQPREKFPEDPSPIREGVAPLKDAKKDGVPPDARWTKIARKLVNPEALEIGKERFEAREDFVIVLRVLSREEIQAYATATQQIRASREEEEDRARRRARREGHERRKRERLERGNSRRHSETDTSEDYDEDRPRMLEAAPAGGNKRITYDDEPSMSGGLGSGEVPIGR